MSASASKQHKRTTTYTELQKAQQAIRKAADPLATIGEALIELSQAIKHINIAGLAAGATKLEWEDEKGKHSSVRRDALPAGIRRKISGLESRINTLMDEVISLPVTKDQVAVAKAQKIRRKSS